MLITKVVQGDTSELAPQYEEYCKTQAAEGNPTDLTLEKWCWTRMATLLFGALTAAPQAAASQAVRPGGAGQAAEQTAKRAANEGEEQKRDDSKKPKKNNE